MRRSRTRQPERRRAPGSRGLRYHWPMDLGRMLDKCVRDQWSIDDLAWTVPPPQMTRDKEEMIVQAFLDMAGIARLPGRRVEVQREKTVEPTLRKIFSTFVADEKRHAAVAARLADHY